MSELKNNSCSGFTLLELILSVCIIGFIVVIAIKNRGGSHTSPANACINNLRQIAAAADQFAKEKGLKAGDKINLPQRPDAIHQAQQRMENSSVSIRWHLFPQKDWRFSNLFSRHHRHPRPRFALKRRRARNLCSLRVR
jgi:prepilin-type N-terminal cleavage/methylation domain-containing protein